MSEIKHDLGERKIHVAVVDQLLRLEFPDQVTGISIEYPTLIVMFVDKPPDDAAARIAAVIAAHAPILSAVQTIAQDGVLYEVLTLYGDLSVKGSDSFTIRVSGTDLPVTFDSAFASVAFQFIDPALVVVSFDDPTRSIDVIPIGDQSLKEPTPADALVMTITSDDPSAIGVIVELKEAKAGREDADRVKELPLAETLKNMSPSELDSYFDNLTLAQAREVLKLLFILVRRFYI